MLINNLDNPLISVIVPIFNQDKVLKTCIDSIINQSYTNIQIILINDGSTDNCAKICNQYKNKDERVLYIEQDNIGQSFTYKTGVQNSNGKYVTFVNADDNISSEMLTSLVRQLQYNTQISACTFNTFSDDEKLKVLNNMEFSVKCKTLLNDSFYDVPVSNRIIGKLYDISLFEDFDFPNINLCAEEFITYKLIYKASKINYLAKPLYNIRINEADPDFNLSVQKFNNLLLAYKQKIDFFFAKKNERLIQMSLNSLFDIYIKYYFSNLKITKQLTKKDFLNAKEQIKLLCNCLGSKEGKKYWALFKFKIIKYGFLDA